MPENNEIPEKPESQIENPMPSELPIMPDIMNQVGAGKSSSKSVSLNLWILIGLGLLLTAPYYFFYNLGYRTGYDAIFNNSGGIQKKTAFSPPLYPVSQIVVNLNESGLSKYLEVSLHLAVREDDELTELNLMDAKIRDTLISFLSGLHLRSHAIDSTKQRELKRLIKDELNATLKSARVTEVLFSNFRIKTLHPEKAIAFES